MNALIEKWSHVLHYKFSSGKSVPINKHQDCAEDLEYLETKYKESEWKDKLNTLITFCARSYAEEDTFNGNALKTVMESTNKLTK